MKKYLSICVAILGSYALTAQCPQAKEGEAKSSDVTNAGISLNTEGNPLDAAKYIERAITHEKAKLKLATWRKRGDIYVALERALPGTCPEALHLAKESFEKAMDLDEKGRYTDLILGGLIETGGVSFNKGLDFYNNKDYAKSAEFFNLTASAYEKAQNTTDSVYLIALFNTGLSYDNNEEIDNAITYYQKSIDVNYDVKQCYYRMINLYNGADRTDDAIALIQKGKAQFPEEAQFYIQETDIYYNAEDFAKAEESLRGAVANDPKNAMLHFVLGTALEQLDKSEDAVKAYKDAIAIDPEYADAYHNLGAAYFNQYVAYTNKAGELDFRTQSAEISELEAKAQDSLKEAMPFLEDSTFLV